MRCCYCEAEVRSSSVNVVFVVRLGIVYIHIYIYLLLWLLLLLLFDEAIVGYIGRTQQGSDSERSTPPTQPTICSRECARFKSYSYNDLHRRHGGRNKPRTYRRFKHSFEWEPYLTCVTSPPLHENSAV